MGIVRCADATSPLFGFPVLEMDPAKFIEFTQYCIDRPSPYVWDGKCLNLGQFPPRWGDFMHGGVPCDGGDCSGFAQAAVRYAMGGGDCPTGSAEIADWCAGLGLKASSAGALSVADGVLRLGVHHADSLDGTGHVIFAVHGHSIESYGGHGCGARDLDVRLSSGHTLRDLMDTVYCLCPFP